MVSAKHNGQSIRLSRKKPSSLIALPLLWNTAIFSAVEDQSLAHLVCSMMPVVGLQRAAAMLQPCLRRLRAAPSFRTADSRFHGQALQLRCRRVCERHQWHRPLALVDQTATGVSHNSAFSMVRAVLISETRRPTIRFCSEAGMSRMASITWRVMATPGAVMVSRLSSVGGCGSAH